MQQRILAKTQMDRAARQVSRARKEYRRAIKRSSNADVVAAASADLCTKEAEHLRLRDVYWHELVYPSLGMKRPWEEE